jgi:hypothetical protein
VQYPEGILTNIRCPPNLIKDIPMVLEVVNIEPRFGLQDLE